MGHTGYGRRLVSGSTLVCNFCTPQLCTQPFGRVSRWVVEAGGLTIGWANQRRVGDHVSPAGETLLDRTSTSQDTFWGLSFVR